MPGSPRKDVVREGEIGTYHTWSRCVQRAFLCGYDPLTGNDYSHRRQWIESLIQYQTSIFCIDVLNYTILSNHMHLICRTRPDLVTLLSDQEVAWRWRMAWPRWFDGQWLRQPTDQQVKELLLSPEKINKIRKALGSLSWFMARIKEPIARLANAESNTKGHFHESRFGCRELADVDGGLCCSIYLDINQMQAGMARSLAESECSAIQRRIQAWRQREARASLEKFQGLDNSPYYPLEQEQVEQLLADCFLAPITDQGPLLLAPERPTLILPASLISEVQEEPAPAAEPAEAVESETDSQNNSSEAAQPEGSAVPASEVADAADSASEQAQVTPEAGKRKRRKRHEGKPTWKIHKRLWARRRRRPSDHGFLGMPWEQYLGVAEAAAARVLGEQAQSEVPLYFQQRRMDPERWYEAFEHFEKWFGRAVGLPQNIERLLQRGGRRWLRGVRRCRATFS